MGGVDGAMPVMNGAAGGEDYQQWVEGKVAKASPQSQSQRHGAEVYSNTLPVRKAAPAKSKTTLRKNTHPLFVCFSSTSRMSASERCRFSPSKDQDESLFKGLDGWKWRGVKRL